MNTNRETNIASGWHSIKYKRILMFDTVYSIPTYMYRSSMGIKGVSIDTKYQYGRRCLIDKERAKHSFLSKRNGSRLI